MNPVVDGVLGFTPRENVVAESGRLRARPNGTYADFSEIVDFQHCALVDLAHAEVRRQLSFAAMGFDLVSLESNARLMRALDTGKATAVISEESERQIRRSLAWRILRLTDGKRLLILHIAREGFLLRKSGPNGMPVGDKTGTPKNSNQRAAVVVHGDQDVHGHPVRQLLKGLAPRLFRHDSPEGANRRSPLVLTNLWLPLQQIDMPLCLMDRRSLNKAEHQLRFSIPVEGVLDRKPGQQANDSWAFLHAPAQQWYCHSDMRLGQAYVFDTLGTPHGAAILHGEKEAEQYYRKLDALLAAVREQRHADLPQLLRTELPPIPEGTSAPLHRAMASIRDLIDQRATTAEPTPNDAAQWIANGEALLASLVRKSIELRALALMF